ncbi:diguanylate cyclase, partial [Aurantimonas sp. A2-1-M11]|uniref:GGDEF domain-containing protein n=1 Tax=Aurantimonas sp. A2-1-M11 TaxID=3113712 RepID=UPI002F92763F
MPLDIQLGVQQSAVSWIIRGIFFVGIGSAAGAMAGELATQMRGARRDARYDPLTNLPNRAMMLQDLQKQIRYCAADARSFDLFTVRLEHLERVAASLGYDYSDALHFSVARRLREALPSAVEVYDLSNGQFAAIAPTADTKGGDNSLCSAILNVLDERYSAGGVPMLAGGVIGISS